MEKTTGYITDVITDNGPNGQRYNGGMRGWKGHVDEGGIRVPLFLKYPARFGENGRIIKELTSVIDILLAIAELCGIPLSDIIEIDGRSLVPLLEASGVDWKERNIYTHQGQDELKISPAYVRFTSIKGNDSVELKSLILRQI